MRIEPTKTEKRRDGRQAFFRSLVRHGFAGWRTVRVLRGTDRLRHQTAGFVRLILERGMKRVAALAVYPEEPTELTNRILSAAVLWWSRLRPAWVGAGPSARPSRATTRGRPHPKVGTQPEMLAILVPEDWSERLLLMLPRLRIPVSCYKYHPSDSRSLRQIYPRPVESSEIRSPYVMFRFEGQVPPLLLEIRARFPPLDLTYRQDRWELGYRGLRLLWYEGARGQYMFSLEAPTAWTPEKQAALETHIEETMARRTFPPPEPGHFAYRVAPELWLESLILQNHRVLNPDFSDVIYSQVPTCLDGERKILDLLTVTTGGRLAVIELKIEKDLGLVFQGLDYWERVEYHLRRGDFQKAGYFPGVKLSDETPLLYLVSPLFEYHRVLPILRLYLAREISLNCVGINTNWKQGLKILRRFVF